MTNYSQKIRMGMVRRMIGPHAVSASSLARETGIAQQTLSRWLREAGTVPPMTDDNNETPEPQLPPRKRPADWTPEEKLQAVLEARGLSDEALGAFLRQRGLHAADLAAWRQAVLVSLGKKKASRQPASESKRLRQLESELRRKDKALAETAALLVLQGKVRALWGAEGDDTKPGHGKRS